MKQVSLFFQTKYLFRNKKNKTMPRKGIGSFNPCLCKRAVSSRATAPQNKKQKYKNKHTRW